MKNHSYITQRLPVPVGVALETAAIEANVSVSRFVLNAVISALPAGIVSNPLPPSPPRRPLVIPPDDIAAISSLGGHIGRLTGATVQLSRACREENHYPEHDAIEAEIRDLRAAKAEIVALVGRLRSVETATR